MTRGGRQARPTQKWPSLLFFVCASNVFLNTASYLYSSAAFLRPSSGCHLGKAVRHTAQPDIPLHLLLLTLNPNIASAARGEQCGANL